MIDLEQEFQALMYKVTLTIEDKYQDGELSFDEAEALKNRIRDCRVLPATDTSRYGERCPDGHSDIESCGWSPSMGYHCV